VAGVFVAVIVLVATGSLAFALSRHAGDGRGAGAVASADEAGTRTSAAEWVAAQVSRTVTVSCDPVMCRALKAHGFPAGDLLQLRPGAAAPLRSKVIVATPVIRRQFGNRLQSVYASAVLARFGSGNLRIDIRVIASHGAAAYESALRADLRARMMSGASLLSSNRIVVSGTARRQLSAGQVDVRLLLTIFGMATKYPVHIVAFTDSGPGASAGSPLRSAELGQTEEVPRTSSSVFMRAMFAVLKTQRRPYVPAHAEMTRLAGGQTVLRIEFAAPSPLGLLSPLPR
jgi:hypothetical protein